MKTYIGTKIIKAEPRAKDYGPSEQQGQRGYTVQYADGYTSWSPAPTFEEAYRETTGMPFGLAVESLKKGLKVARSGWNGKNMFLFLVPGSTFQVNRPPLLGIYPEGHTIQYCSHIDMKTADDKVVPWLASQSDVLADDWVLVE